MKALKDFRIILRSLAGRSLVILSALVLLFAFGACNTGGDDGDDAPVVTEPPPTQQGPGKTPVSMRIIDLPYVDEAFEGQPIDLSGIKVSVRYDDDSFAVVTDTTKFYITPPIYDAT